MKGLERAIAPTLRRIRLAIGLGILRLVNDAAGLQVLQVSIVGGQPRDGVNRYQNYGHSSVPLPGAQVVLAAVGGNLNHLVAIVVDDARYRPKGMQPGESCVYNHLGDFVHVKANGEIHVKASSKVVSDAPLTHALGDMLVDGNLTVVGTIGAGGAITSATSVSAPTVFDLTGSMQAMRVIYNGHTHGGSPPPSASMS